MGFATTGVVVCNTCNKDIPAGKVVEGPNYCGPECEPPYVKRRIRELEDENKRLRGAIERHIA